MNISTLRQLAMLRGAKNGSLQLQFLLPRRQFTSTPLYAAKIKTTKPAVRSSNVAPSKPPVLEQPTEYNPPSHPTGDTRKPAHTPLPPRPHVPERTHYPGMMSEPGTISYWILHSRAFHGLASLGVLLFLTVYVIVYNFMQSSTTANMVFWDWSRPLASIESFFAAYRESDRLNSERIAEKRRKLSQDIEKRAHYRYVVEGKTGSEEEGFGGWGLRRSPKEPLGYGVKIDGKTVEEIIKEREQERLQKEAMAHGQVAQPASDTLKVESIQQTSEEITAESKKKTSFLWW